MGLFIQLMGSLTGAQFGDGHSLSIAYDTVSRATNLSRSHSSGSALMNVGFGCDTNGDILALNDIVRPERSQTFTYDPVSRLKTAAGGATAILAMIVISAVTGHGGWSMMAPLPRPKTTLMTARSALIMLALA